MYIKGYSREKCGGEILSFRGESKEVDGKVKYFKNGRQGEKIIDEGSCVSQTLTATGGNCGDRTFIKEEPKVNVNGLNILEENINSCKQINSAKSQSHRSYSVDGLSKTLTGEFGGGNETTGLYDVTNYDNQVEKFEGHNVVSVSDNEVATTTKNGDFFAVTTRPRNMPLKKCQDNYVIEKCYGSTQKHRAETDGTYSPTLTCAMGKGGGHIPMIKIQNNTKKGYLEAEEEEDGINIGRPDCKTRRGRVQKQKTGTLMTGDGCDWGVHKNYRIRRLTPLECERLQGFPDNWTSKGVDEKGDEVSISDTQRYKCCGNAVTTNVITHIFNNWDLK